MLPRALEHPLRPSLAELKRKHIYLSPIALSSRRLARSLISIRLSRRLAARPTPEVLVERAVLWRECVPTLLLRTNSNRDSIPSLPLESSYSAWKSRANETAVEGSLVRNNGERKHFDAANTYYTKLKDKEKKSNKTAIHAAAVAGMMDPAIAQRRRQVERGLLRIKLSQRLRERPTPEMLVERAVLWRESVPPYSPAALSSTSSECKTTKTRGCSFVATGIVQRRKEVERERTKDMLRRWIREKWCRMVQARQENKDNDVYGHCCGIGGTVITGNHDTIPYNKLGVCKVHKTTFSGP